jgi:hypothetical protein
MRIAFAANPFAHARYCGGLVVLTLLLATCGRSAQSAPEPIDTSSSNLALDILVPESPGLKILGTEESNLLRPASPRKLAVALSGFVQNKDALPAGVAVEFSPGLLISGDSLSQSDFHRRSILYRTRVSIGTRRASESSGATDVGIGLRVTIHDATDLRMDKSFLAFLFNLLKNENEFAVDTARIRGNPVLYESRSQAEKDSIDAEINALVHLRSLNPNEALALKREQKRKENWNKRAIEIGLAMALSSPDSLARNLKPARYGLWLTGGVPLTSKGQVLAGFNWNHSRNDDGHVENEEAALSLRAAIGGVDLKGFLEAEGDWRQEQRPEYLATFGGEVRVSPGIWTEFKIGLSKLAGAASVFETGFGLRFGTPN